jgi:hypothetical protein
MIYGNDRKVHDGGGRPGAPHVAAAGVECDLQNEREPGILAPASHRSRHDATKEVSPAGPLLHARTSGEATKKRRPTPPKLERSAVVPHALYSAPATGLEPVTRWLTATCSTN